MPAEIFGKCISFKSLQLENLQRKPSFRGSKQNLVSEVESSLVDRDNEQHSSQGRVDSCGRMQWRSWYWKFIWNGGVHWRNAILLSEKPFAGERLVYVHREQERVQMELLLTAICQRMQERAPKDDIVRAREDPSQMKTYFRNTNLSKLNATHADVRMELVEHEIDLRIRKQNEHKCTLVFNDELKMGSGVCDRMKKTAKKLAYRQLITMTRETPREDLILKKLKRGWKAVIRPTRSQ